MKNEDTVIERLLLSDLMISHVTQATSLKIGVIGLIMAFCYSQLMFFSGSPFL